MPHFDIVPSGPGWNIDVSCSCGEKRDAEARISGECPACGERFARAA